jgi:Domain of unknown function (DUF4349)
MTASDLIDERFDDLVRELRTLPGAPEDLRERVLASARAREAAGPRRPLRLPRPRLLALALVPAAAAAAVALAIGLRGSNPPRTVHGELSVVRSHEKAASPAVGGGGSGSATATVPAAQRTLRSALDKQDSAVSLPVTPGRLTNVTASLRLRVRGLDGLSRATARAMRITRNLGGFVASVEYGAPGNRNGEAYLTVRVPVAHVQQAVVRFAGLGTILAQHVSIQDLQDTANAQAVQILRLKRTAAQLEARLRGQLSPEERVRLQSRLDSVRGLIRLRTQQHAGTVRQGRLSTFRLELTTRKGAVAAPAKAGRIERAVRHAVSLLAKTIAAGLYLLIVLSPLLLLAAAALAATRFRRRRVEQRLLARA